ncbi:FecR family protein [Sphingopyxis sp. YR583]|uniref:FecR family protein n=1 Tax=Sphingopyxis sp. YR583 TaxID=1881047 RepID=UPI0008A7FB2C|nr:FecR domain-containing protein [Sphingopyxis sp. YR583]SEH12704.1 FecR family protein [Sphingopyxis sp. YR583]
MTDIDPPVSERSETASAWCMKIAERPLTAEEARAFETWLEADPRNNAAFERASFIWRALDGANTSPIRVSVRMDALSALGGQDNEPSWWQRPLVRRSAFGALAASLVAAISLMVLPPAPDARGVDYATALGERRVVMLDDGSRLSMDAASEVSVDYSGDKRQLVLKSGRAKFDVAKNPLKPFSVVAGAKLIVATGTSFSVEILNGEVNVVLFEGHVAVLDRVTKRPAVVPSSGRLSAVDALLQPGQELSLRENGASRLEPVDMARATAWEAGQLSFADEPLGQAVERMNRYSPTKLVVGDPEAAAVEISGVFNANNVDGFVSNVTGVFPVTTVRRGSETVFVTRK